MSTNNQEWWEKRFTIQPTKIDDLCLDSAEAFDAVDNGKPVASFLREELESFLRQEIRQAKIETLEDLYGIYHAFDWGVYDPFTIIQKKISNLKQNDKPTKN